MSDLSWLNPTPHAIAVYASQPLSPVATQHSLPSGRYSLLGPDLHRLDRTSFAWRTHSITSSARAMSVCGRASRSTSARRSGTPTYCGAVSSAGRWSAPDSVVTTARQMTAPEPEFGSDTMTIVAKLRTYQPPRS